MKDKDVCKEQEEAKCDMELSSSANDPASNPIAAELLPIEDNEELEENDEPSASEREEENEDDDPSAFATAVKEAGLGAM